MRCGDFTNIKDLFLPVTYYEDAMAYIKNLDKNVKFYCVTDQKEQAKKILPEVEIVGSANMKEEDGGKASHHYGGPVGVDFSLLMNAKYLIIPNSSFSWWAAYLNTKKAAVIAPKYWASYNKSNGYWSTSDIITDGFIYLDREGKSFSSEQCWKEKNDYESLNEEKFLSVDSGSFTPISLRVFLTILMKQKLVSLKIEFKEIVKKTFFTKKKL